MGCSDKVQKCQTVVDQVVLGGIHALHIPDATVAFFAPCRRYAIVHFRRHPPIDLVDIECIESVLETVGLRAEARDCLVAFPPLISMALTNRPSEEPKRLVVETEPG
ncbi:hypothetical protein [Sphingopyxis sp. NJF-3]